MNMLIDLLPESITINNIEYPINSDFRTGILFETMMSDPKLLEEEKIYTALNLYYDEIPPDYKEAIEQILWFYRCGKELPEADDEESEEEAGRGSAESVYSFEHDDDYIYAAFLTQYGIDLQDVNDLHWWKFKALFKGLNEDSQISKIMVYRSMKITNDMSDAEKKHYREMKRIYALPDKRTEEEKQADFDNTLSGLF